MSLEKPDELYAKFTAIETMMFAITMQLNAQQLADDIASEREALLVFLTNSQLSDAVIQRTLQLLDRMRERLLG